MVIENRQQGASALLPAFCIQPSSCDWTHVVGKGTHAPCFLQQYLHLWIHNSKLFFMSTKSPGFMLFWRNLSLICMVTPVASVLIRCNKFWLYCIYKQTSKKETSISSVNIYFWLCNQNSQFNSRNCSQVHIQSHWLETQQYIYERTMQHDSRIL